MRRIHLLAGVVFSLSAFAQQASAATTEVFDWSLTSPNLQAFGASPVVGEGTITATLSSGSAWTVDAITGSFTDLDLFGTPSYAVTGVGAVEMNVLGVTNDNEIYPSAPTFLDTSGLSFETTSGPIDLSWSPSTNNYEEVSHFGIGTGTFVLTAVPLPPAFPMFASGLVVAGLISRRRKQKSKGDIVAA